jgi:hypothetical protein
MTAIIHIDPATNNEYEIVRDPNAGGWLQGHIDVSYSDLVGAFGDPTYLGSGDGKTQAEWDLRINGVMCTIYDYKEYGKPVQRIREWHIGGTDPDAPTMVQEALAAWKNNR